MTSVDEHAPDHGRSMWLWDDRALPAEVVGFARSERVGDVFLTVPWSGASAATRSLAGALAGSGVRVACLGGDPAWADRPTDAAAWAGRALAVHEFEAVHLDIEPWADAGWPASAERRLTGVARAVEAVRASTELPVEVDVPAALVGTYPAEFTRIVTAATQLTIMAYRDSADAILRLSTAARGLAASAGRRYRIGVDTRPSTDPHATFADDGRTVMDHETATVAADLRADPLFAGMAVHDFTGWRQLGP